MSTTTIRATHRTTRGVLRTRGPVMLTTHLAGLSPSQRSKAIAAHAERVRGILRADRGIAPLPAQVLSPLERATGKVRPLARTWCPVAEGRADLYRVGQTIARLESGYLPDDEQTARELAEARAREEAIRASIHGRPTAASRARQAARRQARRVRERAPDPLDVLHADIEALREAARKAAGDDHRQGARVDSWHDVPRRPGRGAAVAA